MITNYDGKDFYPTPKNLTDKMLDGLDFNYINTVLEPSAGKGNIIEALKEREGKDRWGSQRYKFDIDCIEKDQNLQHILKGKGFRLVHDDFLMFNTWKHYDLVIMNPPFSDVVKHLLKALELQEKNGGAIISLLNAETLKNQCNNDRITLARKLEDYNANIEYIKDSFLNADTERRTDVEIALVKVQLPEVERHSFILDGLKKAQEQKEINTDEEYTYLAENDFLKAIIQQYNMEVEAGINLMREYEAMKPFIMREFGKDKETGKTIQKGGCILELDLSSNRNNYDNKLTVNNFIREVRGKYWDALFKNPKFTGQLTKNLLDDFRNRIEQLKDYDFSAYNICQIKADIQKSVVRGIEDTILSLFEELGNKYCYDEFSKNIHYYNGWKTNKCWIINKKVILPLNAWSSVWGKFEPCRSNYSNNVMSKLQDIEKCFNYLDGGLTDAINLEKQLKVAEKTETTKNIDCKYFTVTFYKKGTCHITFKNEELLKKFNIFGSQHKGWLPPAYGKASYKDMTEEEKEVIKEFDGGEPGYNKVMNNTDYYIFNVNNMNLLEVSA